MINLKSYYFKTTLQNIFAEVNIEDTKKEFSKY